MDNKETKYKKVQFSAKDVLSAAIIGEAVSWLLFVMVRVNAPKLPIPGGLAENLASLSTAFLMAAVLPVLSVAGLYIAYIINKKLRSIYQAAKFALVGALNTFIDFGVLNLLILATGISRGALFVVFAGTSFVAAVVNSYLWNKFWTFNDESGENTKEFAQFLFVSVVGLGLNAGAASFIVNIIGPQAGIADAVWANIGKLIGILFSLVWNFVGYKFWVFKE